MNLYVYEFLNRIKCDNMQRIIVFSKNRFDCDCNVSEMLPSIKRNKVKDFLISDGLIVLMTD